MGLGFVFFAQSEEECGAERRRRRQGGEREKESVFRDAPGWRDAEAWSVTNLKRRLQVIQSLAHPS